MKSGITSFDKVLVPVINDEFRTKYRPCLKIRLERDNNHHHHSPPDPLLLAVKAALNWSTRVGQKLLAGGEYPDDDDYGDREDGYLDVLAEEQALELMKEMNRPKTWEDLACGLHQPNGYHNRIHDVNINNYDEDSKIGDG